MSTDALFPATPQRARATPPVGTPPGSAFGAPSDAPSFAAVLAATDPAAPAPRSPVSPSSRNTAATEPPRRALSSETTQAEPADDPDTRPSGPNPASTPGAASARALALARAQANVRARVEAARAEAARAEAARNAKGAHTPASAATPGRADAAAGADSASAAPDAAAKTMTPTDARSVPAEAGAAGVQAEATRVAAARFTGALRPGPDGGSEASATELATDPGRDATAPARAGRIETPAAWNGEAPDGPAVVTATDLPGVDAIAPVLAGADRTAADAAAAALAAAPRATDDATAAALTAREASARDTSRPAAGAAPKTLERVDTTPTPPPRITSIETATPTVTSEPALQGARSTMARAPRAGEARTETAGLPAASMFADPALAAGAAAAAAGTPAAGGSHGAQPGGSDARGGRRERGLDAATAPANGVAASAPNAADSLDALRVFAERSATPTERSLEPAAASAGAATPASGFAPAATALRADARADTAAPTASYPITVPVQDPRFPDALGERVAWLVREGMQSAELTLHPKELGPIRIDLSIDGDAASIGFSASQADTRGAIEQALPRLREMLADQGLQLGGTLVDAGAGRRGRDDPQARSGRGDSRGEGRGPVDALTDAAAATTGVDATGGPRTGSRSGRLDLFA